MLRFRADLFRRAIKRLTGGRSVAFGSADTTFHDWLATTHLPEELAHFLVENALNAEASFDGLGGMWTPDAMMDLNDQEVLPACGLVGVGSAINGDFIVIDYATADGTSGFVSHDLLWERGRVKDARQAYVPAARSIGEMLHGMTTVEGFPVDYWAAKRDPIMYDADAVAKPAKPCLAEDVEAIQELIHLLRGRLADRSDIEAMAQVEDSETVCRWIGGDLERVQFDRHSHEWVNDMQTVVFSFSRDSLFGQYRPLCVAQRLLGLNPSKFEYITIEERVWVMLRWDQSPSVEPAPQKLERIPSGANGE